jgi:hypothetical protein
MLGLGLGTQEIHRVTEPPAIRWILNADAAPVAGYAYVWIDTSTWADANKWKD